MTEVAGPTPIHGPVPPPSAMARVTARERIDGLAKPLGALGQLEELAVWLAGCQGRSPAVPPRAVRAVVFAGDHGVAAHGVSAYPREVTPAMVRAFLGGGAGVAVLARINDVHLRVLDIAVDDDLVGVPCAVREYKIRRSSGAIHREDAMTVDDTVAALEAGLSVAAEEVAAGADLLIGGDMGIGNTTPAAALIAGCLGLPATEVTGRGTGIDEAGLIRKTAVVRLALSRAGDRVSDPVQLLTALGSADMACGVGFLVGAARAGVPVLLDGVISVAEALIAERFAPGSVEWFAAGHRSPEPAAALALAKLGLLPLLDLGLRLGEGSGAVAAVPLVRAAAELSAGMWSLTDLSG